MQTVKRLTYNEVVGVLASVLEYNSLAAETMLFVDDKGQPVFFDCVEIACADPGGLKVRHEPEATVPDVSVVDGKPLPLSMKELFSVFMR